MQRSRPGRSQTAKTLHLSGLLLSPIIAAAVMSLGSVRVVVMRCDCGAAPTI